VGHNTINYEEHNPRKEATKLTNKFSRQKKYTHTRIKLWEREREEKRMYDVDVERS
jgi:hypothetical protein